MKLKRYCMPLASWVFGVLIDRVPSYAIQYHMYGTEAVYIIIISWEVEIIIGTFYKMLFD